MFNVHTVERVNEPQVGYACCSLLEQLQQAVINTGTPDSPIPLSPQSSLKMLLSFFPLAVF